MTTFGYDFSEAAEGGDFVTVPAGRYLFEFVKVEKGESGAGNPKAIVDLKVTHGAYEGGIVRSHWPVTGPGAFRFQDFLVALGIKPKEKGKVNLAAKYGKLVGARVTTRQGTTERDDGTFPIFNDLNGIVAGKQYEDLIEDPEDEEEPEEEDVEEEDVEEEDWDEEDEEDEDEEDDEEDEEITEELVKSIKDIDELKEIAEEVGASTRKPRGKNLTAAILRKRIIEKLDEFDEDDEDDDEEPF